MSICVLSDRICILFFLLKCSGTLLATKQAITPAISIALHPVSHDPRLLASALLCIPVSTRETGGWPPAPLHMRTCAVHYAPCHVRCRQLRHGVRRAMGAPWGNVRVRLCATAHAWHWYGNKARYRLTGIPVLKSSMRLTRNNEVEFHQAWKTQGGRPCSTMSSIPTSCTTVGGVTSSPQTWSQKHCNAAPLRS